MLLLCRCHLNSFALIFLYNIFIFLYRLGIRITSLWNAKARNWIVGRRSLFHDMEKLIKGNSRIIWIHSSSAGEFEQAKPVIESLKKIYPDYQVLVTFFSPSGYKAALNYKNADFKTYLPEDTAAHAKRFLHIVQPRLVIFVKYDFWHHHLKAVESNNIPLLLISAVFRQNQLFFKPYGSFYRKMLFRFRHIFVQDETSAMLLKSIGVESSVSGDTRFDRVVEIARNFAEVPHIGRFAGSKPVLVAGSTWPGDETHLKLIAAALPSTKLVIAPHEINKAHLDDLKDLFGEAVFYSALKESVDPELYERQILIIDNIGTLSRLYQYASITYIGGGFTKDGIHNTLEPAVYGKPVLFGPNYKKYREAKELIETGGGFSFSTSEELKSTINLLLNDEDTYQKACRASALYITTQKGATEKIVKYIQENRLLTK